MTEYRYRPAWWLRNAHLQTLWGKFARRFPSVRTTRECLTAPDGDSIEVHHLLADEFAPRVLLLHGLEGSARSHYVGGFLSEASARDWGATVMVFRGCGSAPNLAKRFYHSGETQDLGAVFQEVRKRFPHAPWFVAGVSLGGNVILKWLGEQGSSASGRVRAAAAVSAPFDLEAGSRHISQGFAKVYDRSFLRSLRAKALAKLVRYPDLFDREKLGRARTVYEFDDAVTGPVHGFSSARDYYEQSSSMGFLSRIGVPTLLLSSRDDPFLPRHVLKKVEAIADMNQLLSVEFHDAGGHVGFVAGSRPWRPVYYAEWRVFRFFDGTLERR
jgi:predicted alpha/beta-fold hydrolase